MSRAEFASAQRVIVKIGSSLLTDGGRGLNQAAIAEWVAQISQLRQRAVEVVLVCSGAVAEGMCRLGLTQRPKTLHELQAAASIGQMGLNRIFEDNFHRHGLIAAQVLLTHDDLSDRRRYLNARSTLLTLLALGVIPIINENDAVATDEIRFGDNDTLAALVANLLEADLLILLTDQAGLFTADPSLDPAARLISEVSVESPELDQMAGGSRSGLGRGGMSTKVRAARLAARSGAATVIVGGNEPACMERLMRGDVLGTYLAATTEPLMARKRWLAGQLQVKGRLVLDEGAIEVLLHQGRSLLAVGVKQVVGEFQRGDLVACVSAGGREIARGLSNYAAMETRKIAGQPSHRFAQLLGYADEAELIHRDNMVIVATS
ncbi:MAG: glutamate 5-kinase [Methylococcales bacterium]|nr:glutamate 5-kinase [Methylococcales bacterium]